MPKWMRTLAIVLSVLAAAYMISLIPRPSTRPKTPAVPQEIQRFSLISPGLSLTVENGDGGWRLTSPVDVPANDGMVVNFLSGLRALTLEEILSHRTESHSQFNLDDASGILLRVWGTGSKEPQEWVIGKDAPLGGHVYVRVGKGPEVYLAKGLSRSQAEAGLKTWRESRILPLAPDAVIQSVRVRRPKGVLDLQHRSDSWTLNGKPANREKVDRFVSGLRYLSADEFVDPPASQGPLAGELKTPSAELTVVLSSGTPHVLRFGSPEKGGAARVLLQRDGDPHLMRVVLRQVDLLTADTKDLLSP